MQIQFVDQTVIPHGPCPSDEDAMLKRIELCGRVAYKSEDKITDDSAKKFVLMLKNRGHLSVLEHSNIVLRIGGNVNEQCLIAKRFRCELYHRGTYHPMHHEGGELLIAGNARAWLETIDCARETWLGAQLQSAARAHYPILFGGGEHAESQHTVVSDADQVGDLAAYTFKIITDRGITHELVRHRVFSFTQESTRYVNYGNKGPQIIARDTGDPQLNEHRLRMIVDCYLSDIRAGHQPQIARDWLPNLTKTEIFVTGRRSAWQHFIALRDSAAAHPRIRRIAQEVREYFNDFRS